MSKNKITFSDNKVFKNGKYIGVLEDKIGNNIYITDLNGVFKKIILS